MAQYGIVMGENEARRAVEKGYKTNGLPTWEQAYQGAQDWRTSMLTGIAEQERAGIKAYGYTEARDIAETKYDYNQAMREAYATTAKNDVAIMKSNLGQGYKDMYLGENQLALQEAYDSYRKSYLQQKSQIEAQSQSGIESILQQGEKAATSVEKTYQEQLDYLNESLAAEGKNISDLSNATFDYLQMLYDERPELFDVSNFDWYKYAQYFNEEGKLDMSAMMNAMTDYKEVKNEEGKVISYEPKWNEFGVNFFDQMLNYKGETLDIGGKKFDIPHFGAYLAGKNSDLLGWATEQNPWYITEGQGKTGYQIFKELVGTNDDAYSFGERLGALSDEKLNQIFAPYRSESFTTASSFDDALNKINSLSKYIVDDLGISAQKYKNYFDSATQYLHDLQFEKNKYSEGSKVSQRIDEKLNEVYKNTVDKAIDSVKTVVKEDKDIKFEYDASKTINDIKDELKNEFMVHNPDLLDKKRKAYVRDGNTYTATEEYSIPNKERQEIIDIWGSLDAFEKDMGLYKDTIKNDMAKDYPDFADYVDNSSFVGFTQSGILPHSKDGYWTPTNAHNVGISGTHYKKIWSYALGMNIDFDGETVELQDYATSNKHKKFLSETMPDGSLFAYEDNGKKQLIFKANGHLYTLGKIDKGEAGGKRGQEMYDALYNHVLQHQKGN